MIKTLRILVHSKHDIEVDVDYFIAKMLNHLHDYNAFERIKLVDFLEGVYLKNLEKGTQVIRRVFRQMKFSPILTDIMLSDLSVLLKVLYLLTQYHKSLLLESKISSDQQEGEKIEPENERETIHFLIKQFFDKIFHIDHCEINEQKLVLMIKILVELEKNQLSMRADFSDKFLKLQKFCFRFISDHYTGYSLKALEDLLTACIDLQDPFIDFDDGSKLYTKTLFEETRDYVESNWNKFTEEFRNIFEGVIRN